MSNTPCSSSGTYWCFSIPMGMILLERAWAEEQGGWGWESPGSVCKCIWSGHWHSPSPPTDPWPAPTPSPHSLPLSVLQHHKTKARFILSIFLPLAPNDKQKQILQVHTWSYHTLCVSVPGWSLFQLVYVSSSPVIQRNVPVRFSLYKPSQNRSADRPKPGCSQRPAQTWKHAHRFQDRALQAEHKSSPCCYACVQYLLLIMASVALLLAHIPFASLKVRDSSPTLKQEGLCHLQPWGERKCAGL